MLKDVVVLLEDSYGTITLCPAVSLGPVFEGGNITYRGHTAHSRKMLPHELKTNISKWVRRNAKAGDPVLQEDICGCRSAWLWR